MGTINFLQKSWFQAMKDELQPIDEELVGAGSTLVGCARLFVEEKSVGERASVLEELPLSGCGATFVGGICARNRCNMLVVC